MSSFPFFPLVEDYFRQLNIDSARLTRADVAVALLRLGHLEQAQELTGISITQCPSYMPPWPPKPVQRVSTGPVLTYKASDKAYRAGMGERWNLVQVGMTREQLIARGITTRDLKYWAKEGSIKW